MSNSIRDALPIVAAVLVTLCAIYLTPLKHLNVIEPSINDVDAVAFHADFVTNPDDYLFIDVRPEGVYASAHAEGSVSMPLHTLYDERHNLPKSGKKIVLICSGGRASGVGYSYLEHYGFFNIQRIQGGIEQWIVAGLPVEGTNVEGSSD